MRSVRGICGVQGVRGERGVSGVRGECGVRGERGVSGVRGRRCMCCVLIHGVGGVHCHGVANRVGGAAIVGDGEPLSNGTNDCQGNMLSDTVGREAIVVEQAANLGTMFHL